MKTYLRGFLITRELVAQAIDEWSKSNSGKKDGGMFVSACGGFDACVELIYGEIYNRSISVPPIRYRNRTEPTNGKVRRIGIQSAKQQIYDYVVIISLRPMFDRHFGYYQCASLPGKGQIFVKNHVRKWVRAPTSKYFVKLDMKGYYPNCDQKLIRELLRKYVASEDVLYVIDELLSTYSGLNIGSNLCMHLATWLMSFLYHYMEERLIKVRRGDNKRLITHFCMYMDDVLVIGSDKRDLKIACRMINSFARDYMHCTIKPWKICRVGCEPIDLCGYRMQPKNTTIRKRTFKRARRSFLRCERRPCGKRARRCISYFGFLKHSDSDGFIESNNIIKTMRIAKAATRKEAVCNLLES